MPLCHQGTTSFTLDFVGAVSGVPHFHAGVVFVLGGWLLSAIPAVVRPRLVALLP